jgi:hypothetical protein
LHKSVRIAVLALTGALLAAATAYVLTGTGGAPRRVPDEATLQVLAGAESVTVHSTGLGDELYRAATLPGGPVRAHARAKGPVVTVGLSGAAVAGQASVHVYLNDRVRWRIVLAGGGLEQAVDFTSGRLAAVEVKAGAGRVDMSLPRPQGTLEVRLAGGTGALALHVPPAVPARLSGGEVGTLTVDGTARPDKAFTDRAWPAAADRLDVRATGGIAAVTLDRA